MNQISKDVFYIGVNDHKTDLFEGQYIVPNGMAYNSYVVMDESCTVFDTVDGQYINQWLDNLSGVLGARKPDYLVVQHMEPDHSAGIASFLQTYPDAKLVLNEKTKRFIPQFFGANAISDERCVVVADGGTLSTGAHQFTFVFAPMVHWPEVMVTYDSTDKILFSADAFGKFGALDVEEDWACEARRYYFGIVGKYGAQVQALLKKAAALDIQTICPLHGPVLRENIGQYVALYQTWSSYEPESEGIVLAYASMYGNTKKAVLQLAESLRVKGCPQVTVHDLARDDVAEAVEDAFRYGTLVLASPTYNAGVFPPVREFIMRLAERNYQNRTVAIIENGTWAPMAAKGIQSMLADCKNLNFAEPVVTVRSALSEENSKQIEELSSVLCSNYIARSPDMADKKNFKALFNIGYGLYVVTSNDGKRDNGLIVNTVSQVSDAPNRVAVTINKKNYSHHVILQTKKMNVNCLSVDAPFSVFETYGFQSGRAVDKFAGCTPARTDNGLAMLDHYINAVMSLEVEQYVDLETHGMFICSVSEARVINDRPTMTYAYYHENVKPKPQTEGKKGYVCKICGYVYEGDELPADFICPLCKHGVQDFEPIA